MAITPYRPTTELFRTFFEDFPGWGGRMAEMDLLRSPEADVVESENEIRVTLELAGIKPEDIEVNLENNILSITGEKKEEVREEDREKRWHLSERRYGRFSRSFVLPKEVDQDAIQADFDNGVLTVKIPKSERARPRRIEVRNNGGGQQVQGKSNG